jgi:hypothetical protein
MKALRQRLMASGLDSWGQTPLGVRWLWVCGGLLILLGLGHLPALSWHHAGWVGPLSMRKPILFGLATGITLWSLAWLIAWYEQHSRRWTVLAIAGAVGALLEVSVIALQAWRNQPSHFNNSTPLNSFLYISMEIGVGALSLLILCLFFVSIFRPARSHISHEARWLIPIGMGYLTLGVLIGLFMAIQGPIDLAAGRTPNVQPPAGLWKFVHGVPLHAPQWLWPLLWLLPAANVQSAWRHRLLHLAWIGIGLQTLFAGRQVVSGRDRFDAEAVWLLTAGIGMAALLLPWIYGSICLILQKTLRSGHSADPSGLNEHQ